MQDRMISFKELKDKVDSYCITESKKIPSDNTIRNWLKRKNKKDNYNYDEELKEVSSEKKGNKLFFSLNESKRILKEHGIFLKDYKEEAEAHNKKMKKREIELYDSIDEDDPSKSDPEVMAEIDKHKDFNINNEIDKIHTQIIYKMILNELGGYDWFDDIKIRDDIYYSLATDETNLTPRQYLSKQRLKKLSKKRYLKKKKR